MSDKDKRSLDDNQDEGWEPPWSFGVEGEPVDTPAWEFFSTDDAGDSGPDFEKSNGIEIVDADLEKRAGDHPQGISGTPKRSDQPAIDVRASRVRKVRPDVEKRQDRPEDRDGLTDRAILADESPKHESDPTPQNRDAVESQAVLMEPDTEEMTPGEPVPDANVPAATAIEPFSATAENPSDFDSTSVRNPGVDSSGQEPRIDVVTPAGEPDSGPGDLEMMIEFEDVTKRFRNQTVLRNLSFRIPRGQTVCLIGESGCGKTVNLKLMIGLIRPDKGRVSFKGEDLSRMNEKKITATRIKFGFLFQMAALFDSMSIYDNVAFGLREHRLVEEKDLPDYIRERLTEVGLPPGVEWKKPAELSGGQRKRVGLARALALKPEVMLYDEPTTGLDPIMTDIINELILQTQADKSRSGIIVTHEMRTVTKCADRVIMLYPISRLEPDEPQILYDGPAIGLEEHPDPRVRQFVRGEAGERMRELNPDRLGEDPVTGIVVMDPDDIMKARPPRSRD